MTPYESPANAIQIVKTASDIKNMMPKISSHYEPIAIKEGVLFYHVNLLRWEDVASAKVVSIRGLPYISVRRNKWSIWGRKWLIALYLGDFDKFKAEVEQFAPKGHPLCLVLSNFKGPPRRMVRTRFYSLTFGLGMAFVIGVELIKWLFGNT